MRPWALLTIWNFSAGSRQTHRYFNLSPLSSRRVKKSHINRIIQIVLCKTTFNNKSYGIIFCAASFACLPISPLIKPRDITKEFQQKAIQFHGTFHSLKITNWILLLITRAPWGLWKDFHYILLNFISLFLSSLTFLVFYIKLVTTDWMVVLWMLHDILDILENNCHLDQIVGR